MRTIGSKGDPISIQNAYDRLATVKGPDTKESIDYVRVKEQTLKLLTAGFDVEENRSRIPVRFQEKESMVFIVVTNDNLDMIKTQIKLFYDAVRKKHCECESIFDEDCKYIISSNYIEGIQNSVRRIAMNLFGY